MTIQRPGDVKAGAYGVVVVIKGRHLGKIGLYDNDTGRSSAVVYLDHEPFTGPWEVIPLASLRTATKTEERAYQRWLGVALSPAAADWFGIPDAARRQK